LPVRGTYFQLAGYSAISDKSDVEFARWLTIEHGVASIPVSVFCAQAPRERLIRFCFARERATLAAAAAKLQAL
jgi:methionine aminotransferase